MTVFSHIHFGLSAWAGSTAYVKGNRVSNGGNAYQCVQSGTSGLGGTGGPSGGAANITDNTVIWKFLSHIDYTTVQAWNDAWPSTLVDHLVGWVWNDGPLTTTVPGTFAVPYLTSSGHTMGSFTATLTPYPGEGFLDTLLRTNGPLAYNVNNGVTFLFPSTAGNVNYFDVSDSNFILEGFQFFDPIPASSFITHFHQGSGSTNVTVMNCLFDGAGQSGGAFMFDAGGANLNLINCIILDRQPGTTTPNITTRFANAGIVLNCLFIALNGTLTNGAGIICNSGTANTFFIRNSSAFGYTHGIGQGAVNATATVIDHCLTDAGVIGSSAVDNGNNLASQALSTQFINSTNNFRIKLGSPCLNNGVIDTVNNPSKTDMFGIPRKQGGITWDIGPTEFVRSNGIDPETFKFFII